MKDIAGVVILYYPDEALLLRNIQSYLNWIDRLYIIDNSLKDSAAINGILNKLGDKICYTSCSENIGVAAALNKSAKMALDDGYRWLLTMDQDSFFDEEEIGTYFSTFEDIFYIDKKVAIIAPLHDQSKNKEGKETYRNAIAVITSGSLLQLNIWKILGGYLEKLFIDEVDHEYCYRAVAAGYKVVEMQNVHLTHQLGISKKAGYFNVMSRRNRIIHSSKRIYFIVRNYLYVRKKYKTLFPGEFHRRDKEMAIALKNNLLFGDSLITVLKNIIKGYRDFRNDFFSSKI